MKVRDIMLPNRDQLRPQDSIRKVMELLKTSKLLGVPVVDEVGQLIGYFSLSTLFSCLLNDLSIDTPIEAYYIREVAYFREDKSFNNLKELTHWLHTVRVGQTPVVNMANEPIGAITQAGAVNELLDQTEYLYNELSSVIENVPAGIIATDDNGFITLANQYAKNILQGIGGGKYIGEFLSELKDDFEPVVEGAWMIPHKIEYQALKLIATAVPIYQNTIIKGATFVLQDLTDVEGIAHELKIVKELKMTLETVLEVAYEGVAVLDEQGRLNMANANFCKRVGKSKEKIIGENINKFVPLTDNHSPLQVLEIDSKPCVISTLPFTKESKIKGTVVKIYEDLDQLADVMQQVNRINMQLNYYKDELLKVNGTSYIIGNIICSNERTAKLKTQALQVARGNSTILITGESGTGKELFAHSIHNASDRRKEPFIKVNCSAIPGDLAESELFGYEDGAFTGARKQGKPGKFELASGGTIFLDEIGDMPYLLQSKLLRVIQEKEVERVGDVKTRKVDVRIIAATNKDLKRLVAEGKFREDLYYRLNVIDLKIPPLRERKEDIPILADYFINKYNKSFNKRVDGITEAALEVFDHYNWPGNIRELENVIERILNYVEYGLIDLQDLPDEIIQTEKFSGIAGLSLIGQSLANIEQVAIQTALTEAKGNKSKAARLLGISRSKLYEKLSQMPDILVDHRSS
ncbi:sigma 54-interacting transcriptional regulator [Desulfosporosinus nitroreducens]|uniref:Sigma 54-interacting transcriptional regulator n=1 Tax=Desulfosporosinus nitroreducens TaxID=2018668 RepID=A0ABT8QP36_9FIRM|nr:sigma 54-interacting transcriptional regulator [Desulfosporosinus nitroreducens]MCO1599932.1 sigma 54-interacting transcriptional regulator [Desulfosporosinus nitroreducens]MDO0823025.1 sigma 54-interacting transcriptional regulator [Desulfosporosinus nitroreducens]